MPGIPNRIGSHTHARTHRIGSHTQRIGSHIHTHRHTHTEDRFTHTHTHTHYCCSVVK